MPKRKIMMALFLLTLFSHPVFAAGTGGGYWDNLGKAYKRGFTNILTSPLEIPITIQEYHEKSGRPVIRHLAGLLDGALQTITRLSSGGWDLFAGWVPGIQEGIPPTPETLL
ncbi:MAG: hypothetical protein HYZ83_03010 [Candidatus Omnitrophica bacterium]|nr:hypothetical protein [Candidatus Omnitrophota bacterium]